MNKISAPTSGDAPTLGANIKTPKEILLEAIKAGTERRNKQLAAYALEIPAWIDGKLIPGIRDACAKGQTTWEVGLVADDRTAGRGDACVTWGLTVRTSGDKVWVSWEGIVGVPAPVVDVIADVAVVTVEKNKGGRPKKVVEE